MFFFSPYKNISSYFETMYSNLAFSRPCISEDENRMTHCQEFLQLHHLRKEMLTKLFSQYFFSY